MTLFAGKRFRTQGVLELRNYSAITMAIILISTIAAPLPSNQPALPQDLFSNKATSPPAEPGPLGWELGGAATARRGYFGCGSAAGGGAARRAGRASAGKASSSGCHGNRVQATRRERLGRRAAARVPREPRTRPGRAPGQAAGAR